MPSGKDHKEDTWKESDLKKALKPEDKRKSRDDDQKSKERSSRRSEDRRGRREHDDEKKRRRHEDSANGEVDSRRTNKERDVERDREREQDRERRKREEKKDRERTKERDHDRDKRKEKDSEGLKERRTKERSEERERSKDRRKEKERADKEHDRDRLRDKDRAIRKDKESSSGRSEGARERDRSTERRKDLDRNKEKRDDRDKSKERRKEKSGEKRDSEVRKDRDSGRSQGKDGSRERTKEREDRDGKNRDKDRDKQRERERNGEKDKSREHHKEKEKEGLARENEKADRQKSDRYDKDMDRRSKHTERSRERRQGEKGDDKREQRDDIDRRKERSERYGEKEKGDKIKRREKELMASLKQEEDFRREHLKFRSDTLEEADVIDEDVELNRKVSLQRMPSVGTAEEVHDEENDGYHYDDDDFEDYDEDFEDDDDNEEGGDADGDDETSIDVQAHSGLQELLEALNAENEGARTSSSEGRELINEVHRKTNKENVKPMSTTHGRINFVAAKQKQISDKVASRTRRRGQELMHLIDLDVAAFDIFDLPPLNEYELYIKNFGRSDTKQAYVQCNEDNVEKEVQTEEIETRTKWTQNPASDAAGFGDEKDNLEEDLYSLTEKANVDSIRLASFLQRATQTCLILLEESVSEQTNTQFKEKRDMTCSDGYMQLATKHSYLEGRPVKFVHISRVQTHFLLIAYAPVVDKINTTTKIPKSIQDKGLICVWNTNEPSDPQKVLICESTPRCCCLSPSKATLAFAGLEDGSLVAWDLREPSSMHYMSKVSGGDSAVILRSPTFSTAGILKKDESHLSPVVSLLPLVMPGDSARASAGSNIMSDDMLGLSFQLASLEENAFIFLWVVVEFDKTNSAGSESDLGLSPGGKIKLIKSSSISLQSPSRNLPNKSSLQTLILKFLPHDPNHVYVGTDGGYVIHCDRHGSRSPPKAHRPGIDTMERIAAIDLSPWQLPCLLSGSENGNLWLFTLKNEFPLLSWPSSTSGSEILSIQWSHSRPSVFYVLDSQSNLHVWDLLKSDKGPVAVEKVKHGRVTCFELSSDYSASGIGTPGRNAELVLVYESGAVEIHRISSVFSKASGDDLDRFASYLESVL